MLYTRLTRPITTIVFALLLVLGAAIAQQPQRAPEQKTQEVTVYVTRTGTKYHTATCRYLSRSKIPMPLKEAKQRYTPCKVCRPPQ